MTVLELDRVTKAYVSGGLLERSRSTILALDAVSLAMDAGETLGLVGESGSGKSTIARIATGLLRPTAGSVVTLGQRVDGRPERGLRTLRGRLGFVFQDPYASLNPRHRLGETLSLPFRVHRPLDRDARRAEIIRLLERVGLTPAAAFIDKLPHQLSGGQRQRVAIARAIALRPELLIADEPVSSLDVSVAGQILNLLRDVQREIGSSVLLISHDLGLVRAMCDRVVVIHRGRIVETGATEAVFSAPSHAVTRQLLDSMPERLAARDLHEETGT
ncbi:MAG TPA: ATP-binding cassette domain-containing protein [Candidatus Limnocylindria bacterium]|nr:ATP-binding cassette domain-containing protein [Candidatus Limnocylindria bacterium]